MFTRFVKKIGKSKQSDSEQNVVTVGSLGDERTRQAAEFYEALESESWHVRLNAVKTLGPNEHASDTEISALVSLMRNAKENPKVRVAAAESLGLKGYGVDYAFPFLSEMVEDDVAWQDALLALRNVGVANKLVISVLIKALADPEKRAEAATTLGSFGPSARVALSALDSLQGYSGTSTRRAVQDAILKVRGEVPHRPSAEAMAKLLKS